MKMDFTVNKKTEANKTGGGETRDILAFSVKRKDNKTNENKLQNKIKLIHRVVYLIHECE